MFLGSKSINLLVAYINGIRHHAYVNNPYISPVPIYDNFNDWYMKKHKIEDKTVTLFGGIIFYMFVQILITTHLIDL